jgi:hypothetical protein
MDRDLGGELATVGAQSVGIQNGEGLNASHALKLCDKVFVGPVDDVRNSGLQEFVNRTLEKGRGAVIDVDDAPSFTADDEPIIDRV